VPVTLDELCSDCQTKNVLETVVDADQHEDGSGGPADPQLEAGHLVEEARGSLAPSVRTTEAAMTGSAVPIPNSAGRRKRDWALAREAEDCQRTALPRQGSRSP